MDKLKTGLARVCGRACDYGGLKGLEKKHAVLTFWPDPDQSSSMDYLQECAIYRSR